MASPQRLTGAERRAAIIDSAIRLFAEHGFRGATTRSLAQAVGVSEPVLYQHFPSKRDLYKAIIETTMERARGIYQEWDELRVEEFFPRLARMIVEFHEQNSDYIRLLLFSALERHELARMFNERHACAHYEFIARYVEKRVRDGSLREVDPWLTAQCFTAMFADLGLQRVLHPDLNPAGERERLVEHMAAVFLRGIVRIEK